MVSYGTKDVQGNNIVDDGPAGTFEDPHKLVYNVKELPATSVVLYPDQAQITRDIEDVQLKPGVNEVTIKDLTGYCLEHSIKVEGKGDAIITDLIIEPIVRSTTVGGQWGHIRTVFEDDSDDEIEEEEDESEESDPEDDPVFDEIRVIDEEINQIRAKAEDATEEWRNAEVQLTALEKYGATITAEVAAPETMTQFLDAYQESRKILYSQHKAARQAVDQLEKDLWAKQKERARKLKKPTLQKQKAMKEKAKERAKRDERKREKREQREAEKKLKPFGVYRVKVMVEANQETEASLTLKYLVNNAKWYPRYDLRLDSTSNTGQIVYRAHFENKTYETWRDAKITFSSSAQTFGGLKEVVPNMTPWTLSLQKGFARFTSESDNTAGLYSIKEQQALQKKGVNFANNNNNTNQMKPGVWGQTQVEASLRAQQQQAAMRQQQAAMRQQQQAAAPYGGLFGQPQQPQANNLFAQAQSVQANGSRVFGQAQPQAPVSGGLFGAPNNNAQVSTGGGLFGSNSGATGSGVAQGSTLGDIPASGFGQQPTTSGFGASTTSGFGQTSTSGFGQTQTSGFGQASGSGFGQPAEAPADHTSEKPTDAVTPTTEDGASTLAPARAAMLIAESSSSESYGMTTTYEIPGLKTIKSSPLTRRQVVSTIDLPTVTFTSIAVAKLRSAAFLKARFKNSSKHTFLRGVAGLTVDGSFLGQTTIPHCPPDDSISLSLGVDTGVHVSYAKPTLVSSSQGFISKENVTTYKRSIFVHNAKSQALTLTVLDQVPISEDERLRVNIVSPKGLKEGGEAVKTGAPGSTNLDDKWGTATATMKAQGNGEIAYTVKLEKGRSCKLPLEYEVKLPAGEKIVGLT